MPKLSRKFLAEYVEVQKQRFESLLNKDVLIVFGAHELPDKLLDIKLARQADMTNKPEMRTDADGITYTPPCMEFTFEGGQLFFAIEDVNIATTLSGIAINVGDYAVLLRENT